MEECKKEKKITIFFADTEKEANTQELLRNLVDIYTEDWV